MKLNIGQRLTEFRNQMSSVQNLNKNKRCFAFKRK